jgi:hypothetical protein
VLRERPWPGLEGALNAPDTGDQVKLSRASMTPQTTRIDVKRWSTKHDPLVTNQRGSCRGTAHGPHLVLGCRGMWRTPRRGVARHRLIRLRPPVIRPRGPPPGSNDNLRGSPKDIVTLRPDTRMRPISDQSLAEVSTCMLPPAEVLAAAIASDHHHPLCPRRGKVTGAGGGGRCEDNPTSGEECTHS